MKLMGIIQIILIILKLVGVISSPWMVVLIPLWIDLFLRFLIMLLEDH